jgi:hypothetical protein
LAERVDAGRHDGGIRSIVPGRPTDIAARRSGDEPVAEGVVTQILHDYAVSFRDESDPLHSYTHLGTEYGLMGPAQWELSWKRSGASGHVCADVTSGSWAGMWHSLAGAGTDKDRFLDLYKCYPFVRDEFQPRCTGMTIRVRGSGCLRLELRSPDDRILWWATQDLATGERWEELSFSWIPADLRRVKTLNWVVELGAQLCIDCIRLRLEFSSDLSFAQRVFVYSYAKLARCFSFAEGTVREQAHLPAGEADSVPTAGLMVLATCAAWSIGALKRAQAEQTLRKVHGSLSSLPRAKGLLPASVCIRGGRLAPREGAGFSTLGTSLYYHAMLVAAQMLWDAETLASLTAEVREIEFDGLRSGEGYVAHGLANDGLSPLPGSWREWGGDAVLVLLLQRMAEGERAKLKVDASDPGRGGTGYVAEIQSLFYPEFHLDEPDAVTGVDWLRTRRELLAEQKKYFVDRWPRSAAAMEELYGVSAGARPRDLGQVVNSTRAKEPAEIIHPHYVLMSGSLEADPSAVYRVLRVMEKHHLLSPWGMVESFDKDLDSYLPIIDSFHAALECVSAYHLWARAEKKPDEIYEAAQDCPLLWEAVGAFYPANKCW